MYYALVGMLEVAPLGHSDQSGPNLWCYIKRDKDKERDRDRNMDRGTETELTVPVPVL